MAARCPASPGPCPRAATIRRPRCSTRSTKPAMPKQALLDVIAAQKARYHVRELLNAAYSQEPSERAGLFKIIARNRR